MSLINRDEAGGGAPPAAVPDPELKRPKRRHFSAEYKLKVLKQADACKKPGELGALLRREGLYSSHLSSWRRQRDEGALGRKRGRKAADPLEKDNAELRRRAERAEAERAEAERVVARHADRLDARADQLASAISWTAFGFAVLLLVAACAAAAQGLFPSSWSKLVPLGSGLAFLLALSGIVSLVAGWNLLVARIWLAQNLTPRLRQALRHWLAPATSEDKN